MAASVPRMIPVLATNPKSRPDATVQTEKREDDREKSPWTATDVAVSNMGIISDMI